MGLLTILPAGTSPVDPNMSLGSIRIISTKHARTHIRQLPPGPPEGSNPLDPRMQQRVRRSRPREGQ
eukprot:12456852-Alexandrium_andersonii.AAC.1